MGNLWINIISILCLIYLAVLLVAAVCKFFTKDRSQRYAFLKGFKKGSCFLVFFASIPLYAMAVIYGGGNVWEAIFSAIEYSVKLIVLSFEYDTVAVLLSANVIYAVAIYSCFVMVVVNAVLFAFSLAGFRLFNWLYGVLALVQKDSIFIIVGFNEKNEQIVESIREEGGRVILFVEEMKGRDKDVVRSFGYLCKTSYKEFSNNNFYDSLEKYVVKCLQTKAVNIIINTEDEKTNLILTNELFEFIQLHNVKHDIFNRRGLNGYVFCRPEDVSSFSYYVEKTHGAIQYINKYRLVAMDFVSRCPLTEYMSDEIDENYPVLKESCEVNFVMIGFGKLCRQLFHTSVSTQQFVTVKNGIITPKPVHYVIYDRDDSNSDMILNHN